MTMCGVTLTRFPIVIVKQCWSNRQRTNWKWTTDEIDSQTGTIKPAKWLSLSLTHVRIFSKMSKYNCVQFPIKHFRLHEVAWNENMWVPMMRQQLHFQFRQFVCSVSVRSDDDASRSFVRPKHKKTTKTKTTNLKQISLKALIGVVCVTKTQSISLFLCGHLNMKWLHITWDDTIYCHRHWRRRFVADCHRQFNV